METGLATVITSVGRLCCAVCSGRPAKNSFLSDNNLECTVVENQPERVEFNGKLVHYA